MILRFIIANYSSNMPIYTISTHYYDKFKEVPQHEQTKEMIKETLKHRLSILPQIHLSLWKKIDLNSRQTYFIKFVGRFGLNKILLKRIDLDLFLEDFAIDIIKEIMWETVKRDHTSIRYITIKMWKTMSEEEITSLFNYITKANGKGVLINLNEINKWVLQKLNNETIYDLCNCIAKHRLGKFNSVILTYFDKFTDDQINILWVDAVCANPMRIMSSGFKSLDPPIKKVLMQKALSIDIRMLRFCLRNSNVFYFKYQMIIDAVETDGRAIAYLSPHIWSPLTKTQIYNVCLKAVTSYGYSFKYVNKQAYQMLTDNQKKTIETTAIKNHPGSKIYIERMKEKGEYVTFGSELFSEDVSEISI